MNCKEITAVITLFSPPLLILYPSTRKLIFRRLIGLRPPWCKGKRKKGDKSIEGMKNEDKKCVYNCVRMTLIQIVDKIYIDIHAFKSSLIRIYSYVFLILGFEVRTGNTLKRVEKLGFVGKLGLTWRGWGYRVYKMIWTWMWELMWI